MHAPLKLQEVEEATLLQSAAQTGLPGGVMSGSLMLGFDVQQFRNIGVNPTSHVCVWLQSHME